MPVKKKKGRTKMAKCLPCSEDKSKNYVPLKAPPKTNDKINEKEIFDGSRSKKSNKKKY
jgi:hypothetical protein